MLSDVSRKISRSQMLCMGKAQVTSHIHIQLTHEVELQEMQFPEVLVVRATQHKPTCLLRLPLMDAATRLRSASAMASALRKASASTASSRMNLHRHKYSFNHPTQFYCKCLQHKPAYTMVANAIHCWGVSSAAFMYTWHCLQKLPQQ